MWKKKHIDFILDENHYSTTIFRFYPRLSSCHSFGEEPPTKWDEVYKVYYTYSVFVRSKEDSSHKVLFKCVGDEDSSIDEVAARAKLIADGQTSVVNRQGRFVELLDNEVYAFGYGVCWTIKDFGNLGYKYEINMWNWDDTGYRFTLEKDKLKAFGEYLQECCEYMLAHGNPI